jgi:hypothetical protein
LGRLQPHSNGEAKVCSIHPSYSCVQRSANLFHSAHGLSTMRSCNDLAFVIFSFPCYFRFSNLNSFLLATPAAEILDILARRRCRALGFLQEFQSKLDGEDIENRMTLLSATTSPPRFTAAHPSVHSDQFDVIWQSRGPLLLAHPTIGSDAGCKRIRG